MYTVFKNAMANVVFWRLVLGRDLGEIDYQLPRGDGIGAEMI